MKLSIIIPAYNVENYIAKTIESLVNQTIKQFEVIVIDDGSNDNTYNVIDAMLRSSCIKKYKIIRKENGGVSSARNVGIEEASGRYVMFLDGDDYVSEKLVECIYRHICSQEFQIISWAFDKVKPCGEVLLSYIEQYDFDIINMTGIEALENIICNKSLWICMGSAVYCKQFLENNELRFTEGCTSGEDIEFTFKALSRANRVSFINEVLFYYVQRKDSRSNTFDVKKLEAICATDRVYKYLGHDNMADNKKRVLDYLKYNEKISIYLNYLRVVSLKNEALNLIQVFNNIERVFPGLNKYMLQIMSAYKGNDIKLLFKTKLFLVSPKLYAFFVKFNKRLRGKK